jgi:hypothetical protein
MRSKCAGVHFVEAQSPQARISLDLSIRSNHEI